MADDHTQRDALVRAHQHLVEAYAKGALAELPDWMPRDEVYAAAKEGLLDAAGRYDPARGVQFSTYAYYRMRGAIFDQARRLHQQDPMLVARAHAQSRVDDLLESRAADVAAPQGPREAADALAGALEAAAMCVVLGEIDEASRGGVDEDPEREAARRETAARVRDAVRALPEREAWMIDRIYRDGLTIEQAGEALGLTKSWASRLHARALKALREDLSALAAPA